MRQQILKRNRDTGVHMQTQRDLEVLVSGPKPLLRDIIMLGEPRRALGSAKLLPAGEAWTRCKKKCRVYLNGKYYLWQLSLESLSLILPLRLCSME